MESVLSEGIRRGFDVLKVKSPGAECHLVSLGLRAGCCDAAPFAVEDGDGASNGARSRLAPLGQLA